MAINTGKTTVPQSTTYKGFSSRAEESNFKMYDFQLVKQNLINRLSVRKGERVENPEFGTIIYDVLFEPLTEAVKQAILDDITANVNADPRLQTADNIVVSQSDHGISVQARSDLCALQYQKNSHLALTRTAPCVCLNIRSLYKQ
jgi:phage baseplate assembly protein W